MPPIGYEIFLRFSLLLICLPPLLHARTAPQPASAKVDERVELVSIVFHLAGNPEYNSSPLKAYMGDLDAYFAPYKNHPAVELARALRERNGVAYDAVMFMAVHLSDPPKLEPLVPFTDSVPEARWGKDNALEFARRLRDFYHDTNFEKFFRRHEALYRSAALAFQPAIDRVDTGWIQRFYGEKLKGQFHIVIGITGGGGNYGPEIEFADGHSEPYAIIGCYEADASGGCTYPASSIPAYSLTLAHEFSHSFVNPAVFRHASEFASIDKVYAAVADQLRELAYGSARTMLDESLVRAGVILYAESRGESPDRIRRSIILEQMIGFVWMDDLCDLLHRYQSQRAQYPDFDSFMGQVAALFASISAKVQQKISYFEEKRPHVIKIEPFANQSESVDSNTTDLTITFDKPVDPAKIDLPTAVPDRFPVVGTPALSPGNRAIRFHLKLKPNSSYSVLLKWWTFRSVDGYPLKEYQLTFRTQPAPSQ